VASGTLVKRVMVQIQSDDGDTEEKLDRITAKADELKEKHPELSVKIDTAAASAKLAVLRQELKDVSADSPDIKPKVDDGSLAALKDKLDSASSPQVKPKVDSNAARKAGQQAGNESGSGFSEGFGLQGYAITAGIVAAIAALPAIAASGGAAAGIALGAALLVGTSTVKGPLYSQFQSMTSGLMSVLRVSVLPLVQPLAAAFAQVTAWAKALYPELHAVFGSLGPLVAPFAQGLEGLVSGLLPGFLTLMRAAAPAVQAVASVLSGLGGSLGALFAQLAPSVRQSSQFFTGLMTTVLRLLPVIGSLAQILSSLLAPVARTLGSTVMPVLDRAFAQVAKAISPLAAQIGELASAGLTVVARAAAGLIPTLTRMISVFAAGLAPILPPLTRAVTQVGNAIASAMNRQLVAVLAPAERVSAALLTMLAKVIVPNLPALANLAAALVKVGISLTPLLTPTAQFSGILANLAARVIPPLLPLLTDLANALATVANLAAEAVSLLSRIPGLGGGGGAAYTPANIAGAVMGGVNLPPGLTGAGGASSATAAYNAAAAAAGADYGSNWADGVTSGMVATAQKTTRPAAANIGLILSQGILAGLTGTASQVQSAVSKLLSAVSTDVSGKYISQAEGTSLSRWLENDQNTLETLANRRQAVLNQIAAAHAAVKSTASSTESTFSLTAAAGSVTSALGAGGIIGQLLGDVAQIRVFKANIARLSKMGLNKAYISQLIAAGPVQGGQIAAELAAGNMGDIREINSAESQIAKASTSLGYTAAEAMYDSGRQAGKGFLSGLQAEQKQLEAAMKKLADVLVNTIKRELKISSPSQVARDLFRMVPRGGALGLDDGASEMAAAAARMARAAVPGYGAAGSGGTAPRIVIELKGDAAFRTWLKKSIRITGGDVTVVGA